MKPKLLWVILIVAMLVFNHTHSANILMPIPFVIRSLHGMFYSIAIALANDGHNVTVFTSFDPPVNHPNIQHFQPRNYIKDFTMDNLFEVKSPLTLFKSLAQMMESLSLSLWKTPEVWELHERRHQFDAIVMISYYSEMLFPFMDDFEGHLILVCTPGVEHKTLTYSGNWLTPAVVPHIQAPYDEYMSFYERVVNTFSFGVDFIVTKILIEPSLIRSMQQFFPNFGNPRKYYERTSLTLINGHFSLDSPVPLLPNQVEIGTINARKPKPLPQDLQDIFDKAPPEGVIYFSLGSFAPSKSIPRKYKEIFVEAFRRIPHQVIWRYDEQDFDFPPNVHTSKWLPQEDILGDPKTKVFISHCGNLGTQEAKFHGVPVLAMPIAFDQPRNAARLVRKGYGVIVNWDDLTVDRLIESIDTLTKDNTYYERMKNVSKIVQDQIDSPAERAAWWVEYVIRHDGAPHLRYAGQRLSFWQYIMVDVLAFWAVVFGLIVVVFIWTLKALWRKCFGKKKKTKKE